MALPPDIDPVPATRTPIWVRVALVASLTLNLLVVGIVAGAVIGGERHGGAERSVRELAGSPFFRALEPDERRTLVRNTLRQSEEPLLRTRRELRARFDAIMDTLRAEEFDRAAMETLLASQRDAARERQVLGERVLLDYLEGLSVEDRRAYADRLDQSFKPGRKSN